ncbi:MAG: exodeoxyribonuclease III [Elusimicrobia bacterium CG1_02_63_36]|nr:MAG: exodeoxyribonuclease III [Elusimicrobia bacterium CG1_02_63_36]PIP82215.1 MAG: exodeoxyribonuclease III [Elusimicrobia bacterium CG22_combo_CG10-13_8_21_14_all_63_91]PJA12798.1 MAG: exodeoxyribonuclease III [Elusimicrobia bacterium CG_4_10_14_0_2_um_filter_63_34]PJB23014.1 MAG: exodeoxyribonuclease III [Elusimicrobia bacterium CG_4_9_14_3_um_filter_62_55]
MPKKSKSYRLISWNVNGIRAASKKGLLEWMPVSGGDVVCLQETKALPEQLSDEIRAVDGFRSSYHSAERKGYSGVAIYSKPEPVKVETALGVDEFDREGRVIAHHYPEFSLFNVYFPNGKARAERLDYKMRFYAWFLKLMGSYHKKGIENLVVCGDVNTAHKEIDLARPKENEKVSGFLPQERVWIDSFLAAGFIDSFREFESGGAHYTWWDQMTRARERNVGWRIDYFFVSQSLRKNLKSARIHPDVMGSDHCPIEVVLKF